LKWTKEHTLSTGNYCRHAPLKELVLRGSLEGTTPLLLACSHGDLEMVKYLVEKWGVGVNQTAAHYQDRYFKIEKAAPVFVASYNRHFSIVEYLIEKGADLSLETISEWGHLCNLTPLLGAICHLNPHRDFLYCDEVVETKVIPLVRLLLENGASLTTLQDDYPIWTGLASYSRNLTTLLVHHGMALDKPFLEWGLRYQRGETALHHWTNLGKTNEEDSLAVVKLLVDKGAHLMIRDQKGNTPILTAVESRNWKVVDYLVENDGLDRTEKIDAMELAAALILNKSPDDFLLERAREYFRRAFLLREEESDPILKTPLTLKSGRIIEWTTTAEVEAGIQTLRLLLNTRSVLPHPFKNLSQ